MTHHNEAYKRIRLKALHAFEEPPAPPEYNRPSDLFGLIEGSGYDNWDAIHLWIDEEKRTALARRIFWRSLFDSKRFSDAAMGARYGLDETPSLVISDYSPPYETVSVYWMALLGAIPAETLSDENDTSSRVLHLRLKLPLGDLAMICDRYEGGWDTLIQSYHDLHRWILTTPRLSSTLKE